MFDGVCTRVLFELASPLVIGLQKVTWRRRGMTATPSRNALSRPAPAQRCADDLPVGHSV